MEESIGVSTCDLLEMSLLSDGNFCAADVSTTSSEIMSLPWASFSGEVPNLAIKTIG